ncbi:MAG TPA: PAS domain S-box protein [Gemmatimonadaceae bacterium]
MSRKGRAHLLAVLATATAVFVRWLLDPVMGDSLPLATLFGAVAASVWLGGYLPAVLAALLGYVACSWLFIEPRASLVLTNPETIVGLAVYLLTCVVIIALGERMRGAQRRASEGSELLRVTLRSIGDAVVTTDMTGRINYLNEVAESLTGWNHADAVGKPLESVFRIVNESTGEPVENPAARALREGIVVGLANHTLLIRRDGSRLAIDDSAAPIRDEGGHVAGCVLIFRDVEAQRLAQINQARQLMVAKTLAAIVESSDDAIISKSLQGIIQSWNAAAERLFGYTAGQAIGRHISLVIPSDRTAEEDEIIKRLRNGERIDHFETERVRSDGQRIQVSLTISPIRDDTGAVVGASKIVRDITERKRVEADRQMFVTLVETSTDFIGMSDLEGIPFFVNRAGLLQVGLTSIEQAKNTPVREFFFPEDQHWIMEEFFPQVRTQGHGEVEVRFRNFRTGEARWMAYKVVTLTNGNGEPTAFATVSQDVTDRRRMEDHLRALASDLSEADRRKNEFLATLAHELRNPLAPISNAVQVLRRRGAVDPEAVEAASGLLQRQVAHLARLVDDLLDMSRITRGRIELRREKVELATVVRQVVEATRAQFRSQNHELTIAMPDEPVFLDADATRIAQILGNLLTNACKFTDRGGRVSLTVERRNGSVEIRVRDNGIGIAVGDLPKVFEMFTQLDSSLERSRDGLGIGLTLVKNLVEMHGGSISVRSEGLGTGSEFLVSLPTIGDTASIEGNGSTRDAEPSAGRRILIVDDNEDGASSLSMLLKLGGHDTFIAHDGRQALALANELRPEVILLDIGLPGMSGYEVCRAIREEPWGRNIVLVAVTGWGQEDDRSRSREAGFDAHIVKPVDPDVLAKIIAPVTSRGAVA